MINSFGMVHRTFLAGILVALAVLSGVRTGAAAAQESGEFTSETFGFSIDWDSAVWTGSELEGDDMTEGVYFESVSSYGQIQGYAADYADGNSCLAAIAGGFADDDGADIEDFGVAPVKMERPEAIDGADAELYTYTFVGEGDRESGIDQAMYVSCQPLAGDQTFLQIVLATQPDIYGDVVSEWDDLLAGISIDGNVAGPQSNHDATGEEGAEMSDGSYQNATYGMALAWDAGLWLPTEIIDGDDVSIGVILQTADSYANIQVNPSKYDSAEDCLDSVSEIYAGNDSVEDYAAAPRRLDRPELADEAAGDLFAYYDNGIDEDMVIYNECRMLDGDLGLSLQILTSRDSYEDELPLWQDVLDAVEIGPIELDSAPIADDDAADTDASIDEVSTSNFGVDIAYDTNVWSIEKATDENNIDDVEFDSEFGIVEVTVTETSADAASCLDTVIDVETGIALDGEIAKAPRKVERPESTDSATGELYAFDIDSDDGPISVYSYLECREIPDDGAVVIVIARTLQDGYEDALPYINDLLQGIDA